MKKFYAILFVMLGFSIYSTAQVIELIGTGMVDQSSATLTFSNPENIEAITLGALYKAAPDNPHDGSVTFEDADEGAPPTSIWNDYTNVIDKAPLNTNDNIGFWSDSFSTADAGGVEVVITDPDDKPYVLAAYAYLYRTLPYEATYKSYVSSETVFFYHNGSDDPYVYTLTIDAASGPRDITVKVPVAELDDTERYVVIDIAAGSVNLHAEETTWNYGESFFIGTYTLEDVPGDVTEVTVSIYSPILPEGDGDSFFVNGVLVNVDNECGDCEGQITSLDLEYLGDEVDATIKVYSKKVEPDKLLATFTNVNYGDVLSFVGDPDKEFKMGSKIRITIEAGGDRCEEDDYTEIHTSCSQDIYVGMIFGDFKILAGVSHEGGPLCEIEQPGDEECGECEGQITYLNLEYIGDEEDVTVKVYKKKVKPSNLLAEFEHVYPGDFLEFTGNGNDNKMGSKIRITIDDESRGGGDDDDDDYTEIHTSCSQDIYVGMEFDELYRIEAGTSHEGGPLCEYTPQEEDECGECEGQITYLNLEYIGDEEDVTVTVYKKKVKPSNLLAEFEHVYPGDFLEFTGNGNDNKMGSKIRITIDDDSRGGGDDDDYTEIHTSCSQDIYVGMEFDDLYRIEAGTSHEGGPLCEYPGDDDDGDDDDDEDCDECEGQITFLNLEFLGDESNATIGVYEGKLKDDKLFETFTGIDNGDSFSFFGSKNDNKMGAKIFLTINGDDDNAIEIHTSCSQDIYAGMEYGDKYLILSGTSHEGGPLCEYDPDKAAGITPNSQELVVYPNPMSHYGTLSFVASENANTIVEVYNLVGTRVDVLFNDYVESGSKTSLSVDANKYPKGMYLIYVRNGSNVYKEKITIVN